MAKRLSSRVGLTGASLALVGSLLAPTAAFAADEAPRHVDQNKNSLWEVDGPGAGILIQDEAVDKDLPGGQYGSVGAVGNGHGDREISPLESAYILETYADIDKSWVPEDSEPSTRGPVGRWDRFRDPNQAPDELLVSSYGDFDEDMPFIERPPAWQGVDETELSNGKWDSWEGAAEESVWRAARALQEEHEDEMDLEAGDYAEKVPGSWAEDAYPLGSDPAADRQRGVDNIYDQAKAFADAYRNADGPITTAAITTHQPYYDDADLWFWRDVREGAKDFGPDKSNEWLSNEVGYRPFVNGDLDVPTALVLTHGSQNPLTSLHKRDLVKVTLQATAGDTPIPYAVMWVEPSELTAWPSLGSQGPSGPALSVKQALGSQGPVKLIADENGVAELEVLAGGPQEYRVLTYNPAECIERFASDDSDRSDVIWTTCDPEFEESRFRLHSDPARNDLLSIQKRGNGSGTQTKFEEGNPDVTWTYEIRNGLSDTFTGVIVTDDKEGVVESCPSALGFGKKTCELDGSIDLTESPFEYDNTAQVCWFSPITKWDSEFFETDEVRHCSTSNTWRAKREKEVVPVAPEVTQTSCAAPGLHEDPSITLPDDTDQVKYSMTGDVKPGGTVVVTAEFQDWHVFAGASKSPGWSGGAGSKTARYEVTFDEPDCVVPAVLEAPEVTQAVCTAPGELTAPTITLPETEGIEYSVDEDDIYPGARVYVHASVRDGYTMELTPGWSISPSGLTAFYIAVLDDVPCDLEEPVAPVAPEVTQAVCTAPGVSSDPTVELTETEGIEYEIEGNVTPGSTVTVTATAQDGYTLEAAEGWELSDGQASFEVTLDEIDCTESAAPVAPTITQAVCEVPGDPIIDPSIELAETEGIDYSFDGDLAPGETITVTAAAQDGYVLSESEGWTMQDDGTATFEVTFDDIDCEPEGVAPVAPAVTQAVCTAPGQFADPAVDLPETEGITYSLDGDVAPGSTVTITATADSGYALEDVSGWEVSEDQTSATFEVVLDEVDCVVETAPVAPTVTQGVCVVPGEPITQPTVETPTTEGITYTQEGDVEAGSTVTVIATANEGHTLASVPGWTVADDGLTARYEVVLDDINCEADVVSPTAPTVTQAVCTAPGQSSDPVVEIAEDTEAITYTRSGEISQGSTVTVTAQASPGFILTGGEGWEVSEDQTSATFEVVLDEVDCVVETAPAAPAVTQAVCTAPGQFADPAVDLPETEGITYSLDGDVAPGSTVTVTATAQDGYTLSESEGWTAQAGTAEFEVVLDEIDCVEKVTPLAPTITQGACVAPGEPATEPTFELAETEGIVYETDGDIEQGATVTVTAKLEEGFAFGDLGEDWTLVDGSAVFETTLDEVDCPAPVEPEEPEDPTEPEPDTQEPTEATPDPELQVTGAAVIALGIVAALLLAAGGAVMFLRRKRSES